MRRMDSPSHAKSLCEVHDSIEPRYMDEFNAVKWRAPGPIDVPCPMFASIFVECRLERNNTEPIPP